MAVVTQGTEITVTPAIVVSATILPLTLAGVVTWLLTRWKAALRTALAWSGLAVGIGTIPVPLLSAPQTATGWTLATMHLIAGSRGSPRCRSTRGGHGQNPVVEQEPHDVTSACPP